MNLSSNLKGVIMRSVLTVLVIGAGVAGAQEPYRITDLGAIGGEFALARGLNDQGWVVGSTGVRWPGRAFIWRCGNMTLIDTLGGAWNVAWSIGDDGHVSGVSALNGKPDHAFLWRDGKTIDLDPRELLSFSWAYGMNDEGDVVGDGLYPHQSPILWRDGRISRVLDRNLSGRATGINNAGQIVGWTAGRAFLRHGEDVIDLGTLDGKMTFATDLNEKIQIVGQSGESAFIWERGEMRNLGFIQGYARYTANAINEYGEVVGWARWWSAFFWADGEMLNVNDFRPEGFAPWLNWAHGINDAGQIIAASGLDAGRSFLLTPRVCRGFITCDANCDGSVDLTDVEGFIECLLG